MIDYDANMIHCLITARKVMITSHIYPDGDAAGSAAGLGRSLIKNGAEVDIVLSTEVGDRYRFLLRDMMVKSPDDMAETYDLAVILDIGSEDRTGFQERIRALGCPVINIDHHATNEGFGTYSVVDADASSTCQMIYYLLKQARLPLDIDVAEPLYTGLLTDSRYFQNANVNAETFRAAAALLETGLDTRPIIRKLTQSRSLLDLKVLGIGLLRLRTLLGGKIVYTTIRKEEFDAIGASFRHAWSAGLFGYLISLDTALVAVSFIEGNDGKVFCEFRSKMGFDVSGIATEFGGGGHKSASGCSNTADIDELARRVLSRLTENVLGSESLEHSGNHESPVPVA